MSQRSQPYSLDNYSPSESIGYLLKRSGILLSTAVDRGLAQYDMTHAQFSIVFKLLHGHARTAAELARDSMTDTGAMTRMLDRLEEKGIVQRMRSSADRRVVEVELTDKGRQLADDMMRVAVEVLNHHLRGFAPEEIEQFKGFLRRMIANA
ncbi:MarR family winged helix-turn-helix transcriptional regulator [Noviherbaspirillum galbum]|uniref:MarR family transcriptional regulator n=1 Tax=Noviherbaspirillum galbum TaxID=2709383 RepID=A0A6B3SGB0_9BURK|nr:MarR family transcriptional regulator [Noviherbaspirillum galbum]NEX59894.1 MarR family transcriptional regulator [Noviherbaspirillum galbum]